MSPKIYKITLGTLLSITAVGLVWLAVIKIRAHRQRTQVVTAKEKVGKTRATESNAIVAKVQARQHADETTHAKTIDLVSFVNTSLNSSFVPKTANDNNLAEIQEGVQTLAGVPFHIRGTIQLSGRDMRLYGRASFPRAVENIRVGTTCDTLYILHGSYFVKKLDVTIAKLILHYANGTTEEIPIITGKHLLDWWAPNYETGVKKEWRDVSAAGSELAWVGSNAYIKKRQPHLSLRLFKSTFHNPQPSLEITTIDYVSTDTAAAPFLVGLTVE